MRTLTNEQTIKQMVTEAYLKSEKRNKQWQKEVIQWLLSEGFEQIEGNRYELIVEDILFIRIYVSSSALRLLYSNIKKDFNYRSYGNITGLLCDVTNLILEVTNQL